MKNLRKSLFNIFAALMAASLFFVSCAKPYDDSEESVELTEQETNLAANDKEAAGDANEKQNSIENTKEPVEYPLYFTRSAFWMMSTNPYAEGDETEDNSNFCYFIVNSEDDITWVTYPQVEDEEYGEDYRERQEYKLTQMDNGLWNLSEEVSEADLYDSSNSSNLGMLGMMSDYVEGLELHFEDDTIFVDYKGYLQIKEWYTKVSTEPQTQKYIY